MTFAQLWISSKLVRREGYHEVPTLTHWCPACSELHDFAVERPFSNGAGWSYDGNAARPTFTPSMNIVVGPFPDGHKKVCHYFLKAGMLEYLSDCTHALAGKTIELPDLPIRREGKYAWLGSTQVNGVSNAAS